MDFKQFLIEAELDLNTESTDERAYKAEKISNMSVVFWNLYLRNNKDFDKTYEEMDDMYKYETKGKAYLDPKNAIYVSKELSKGKKLGHKTADESDPADRVPFKYFNKRFFENAIKEFTDALGDELLSWALSGDKATGAVISKEWKDFGIGGQGQSPKTTFFSGENAKNSQKRIMYKNIDSKWLFNSTSSKEITATFHAAFLKLTKDKPDEVTKDLIDKITTRFKHITTAKTGKRTITASGIDKAFENIKKAFNEKGLDPSKSEDIDMFLKNSEIKNPEELKYIQYLKSELEAMRDVSKDLSPVVEDYFDNNPDIKAYFVLESLSGEYKWGKDSIGNSNYIMMVKPENGEIVLKPIDLELAKELSKNSRIRVSLKPSGNINLYNNLSISDSYIRKIVLTNVLTEGFFDNLKQILSNITMWFRDKLVNGFRKGLNAGLKVMGIEINKVEVDFDMTGDELFKILKSK